MSNMESLSEFWSVKNNGVDIELSDALASCRWFLATKASTSSKNDDMPALGLFDGEEFFLKRSEESLEDEFDESIGESVACGLSERILEEDLVFWSFPLFFCSCCLPRFVKNSSNVSFLVFGLPDTAFPLI
jgi:hypothetical protein